MIDFKGIDAKIKRADSQIRALNADMRRFCKDVTQSIIPEVDHNSNEQVWIYRGVTPDAPIEWSIRIGEVLHNLRSALDHAVWQLVLANCQEPGTHNAFPISETCTAWTSEANRRLKGISQRCREHIRLLQPFSGGMNLAFDVSVFLTLHRLCNIDKHRHINVLSFNSEIGPRGFGEDNLQEKLATATRPLKASFVPGEIKVGKIMARCNNPQVGWHPDFRIEIRFDYPEYPELVAGTVPSILCECRQATREGIRLLRSCA